MIYPISIIVYPLFGGWRAECETCGAYANSSDNKYKHPIVDALDNLSKAPTIFTAKSNNCPHKYGSYKPRVTCYVNEKDVESVPRPRRLSYEYMHNAQSGRYEPNFDAIASGNGRVTEVCVDNKCNLHVNHTTPSVREQEELEKHETDIVDEELEQNIQNAMALIQMTMQTHEQNLVRLKYIAVCLMLLISSLLIYGALTTR